jgi:CRISPR/Cas system-associated endoribonuclease Cas2
MDVKRLKQEHADMLAFLQNAENQQQQQQPIGNQNVQQQNQM